MRIALMLAAMVTAVATVPSAAQETVQKVEEQPTKLVCKRYKATGTRLKNRRVCAPQEEWYQRERADQNHLRKMQSDDFISATSLLSAGGRAAPGGGPN